MSADNGIYILKTKDQYRVIHAQAIENLCWSHINSKLMSKPVPTRVIEYFGNTRYTRNFDMAMRVARGMAKSHPILEYGIQIIEIDKTWKQIVKEAKKVAIDELSLLNESNDSGYWDYEIKQLKRIVE